MYSERINTKTKPMKTEMKIKDKKRYSQRWHNLQWNKITKYVEVLQKEIALAKRSRKTSKMYASQDKLLRSFQGRALAVRRATALNKGKTTAGIDGVLYTKAYEKYAAISELKTLLEMKNYKADPVIRVYIPKPNTDKWRPLGIPTMRDRCYQALHHLILDPVVEEKSDLTSYGFRRNRSTADAINRIYHILRQNGGRKRWSYWVWDADIEKCFDEISHEFLLKTLAKGHVWDTKPYEQWLKAGVKDKGVIIYPEKGTPQGGIISPLLCNVALNGLDKIIRPYKNRPNSVQDKKHIGRHFVRYADDFIITSRTREDLESIISKVKAFLLKRGLQISEEKTRIVHIDEGFEFLSWEIKNRRFRYDLNKRSETGIQSEKVLVIRPTTQSVKRIRASVRNILEKHRRAPFGAIIKALNPVLRGWCNYYRHEEQGQIAIQKVGHYVMRTVLRFLVKRHKNRPLSWIIKKYRYSSDTRTWIFGTAEGSRLVDCSELTLKRHKKQLELNKNPYVDIEYFKERRSMLLLDGLYDKVLKKYQDSCAFCNEKFEPDDAIEFHHIKPVRKNGKSTVKNLMPLHQTCHHAITYGRLNSTSPKYHK
jgi:RNA-directed DNA polymerase